MCNGTSIAEDIKLDCQCRALYMRCTFQLRMALLCAITVCRLVTVCKSTALLRCAYYAIFHTMCNFRGGFWSEKSSYLVLPLLAVRPRSASIPASSASVRSNCRFIRSACITRRPSSVKKVNYAYRHACRRSHQPQAEACDSSCTMTAR
jgi:hypothetical protein